MLFDICYGPEPSSIQFVRRSYFSIIDCLIDKNKFFLTLAFKYIMSDLFWCIISQAQFLTHFTTQRFFYTLAQINVSANSGVPFTWLYVFPFRTFLQIEFPLTIEHMQMHHGMQKLSATMALATCGSTCYVAIFINDGEKFFLIIFHFMKVLKVRNLRSLRNGNCGIEHSHKLSSSLHAEKLIPATKGLTEADGSW